MNVLGINAYHADVSAVLVRNGDLVAAVEEERFRRVKHWAGFPQEAIRACLDMAALEPGAIDAIAVSRKPRAHWLRKAAFTLRYRPNWRLGIERLSNWSQIERLPAMLDQALDLPSSGAANRLHWVEHHPAHLASAFLVSPFDEAAVCAIDGFGDFVSTSAAVGRGNQIDVRSHVFFPHSLGLLYLAVTQFLGFLGYGDEYKVMGLTAYGEPDSADKIRQLVRLTSRGRFEIDLRYFQHHISGITTTWDDGEPVFGKVFTPLLETLLGPARRKDEPLTARHESLAASVQVVFEEAVFHVLRGVHQTTKLKRLCLAGGCAMNSVANGKIREHTPFEELYVQPAAGDNGTALGAAFAVFHAKTNQPRRFVMEHGYWGPAFSQEDIGRSLTPRRAEWEALGCTLTEAADTEGLCRAVARDLAEGNVVGWFQGRMEWGARALGNRSILADPRRADMRDIINAKIKFREKFRPFAPVVVEDALHEYFVGAVPDPFMIQVYPVRAEKRSVIPAVTHADGSGRLQTVNDRTNPLFHQLLRAFEQLTGVPILLNTSFNENEPIVHTPDQALDCFLRTGMDVLVLGRTLLHKRAARAGGVASEGERWT